MRGVNSYNGCLSDRIRCLPPYHAGPAAQRTLGRHYALVETRLVGPCRWSNVQLLATHARPRKKVTTQRLFFIHFLPVKGSLF
jgi:hypothetical protein